MIDPGDDMSHRSLYEHKTEAPISWPAFRRRMRKHGSYALGLIAASLMLGMLGYHLIARQTWADSFLNTSMLLGGMGPVGELRSDSAKIFAGLFALYAGLVFLVVSILLLTPIFHRVLHKFHWENRAHGE